MCVLVHIVHVDHTRVNQTTRWDVVGARGVVTPPAGEVQGGPAEGEEERLSAGGVTAQQLRGLDFSADARAEQGPPLLRCPRCHRLHPAILT